MNVSCFVIHLMIQWQVNYRNYIKKRPIGLSQQDHETVPLHRYILNQTNPLHKRLFREKTHAQSLRMIDVFSTWGCSFNRPDRLGPMTCYRAEPVWPIKRTAP